MKVCREIQITGAVVPILLFNRASIRSAMFFIGIGSLGLWAFIDKVDYSLDRV